ncbi:aminodeoxychorismate synthase component I [Paracoccus methylarcula]|uniref:Aminodeoxychorismate synthase component I n=1 Tax=Paracoccus methylarcula TaxID=72022 RepID=A0A422QW96_9RHOB|nr:aminodeoxychorismate synthase component I [Paracoccus methylarcula]RNF34210.1 aminodeoxychorismate synthase component I [Paracoccus methylarcula]
MSGQVRFDHGPLPGGALFTAPQTVIRADTPAGVIPALAAMEAARARGCWLAGYLSYELGYALTPRLAPLMPLGRDVPLILMGVFDRPRHAPDLPDPAGIRLAAPRPLWSRDRYDRAIAEVHRYIEAGDTYQINLTFPMEAEAEGDPLAIYAALAARQPVGEGAFVDLGGPVVLSRSPELFFATDHAGRIETRPMKGTAPRGATPEKDRAAAEALAASEKDRAENLMIVDLLRNDISRVCLPGSVRVPKLFEIEPYATVHQMTSTVTGQLTDDAGLSDILRALFPCGSITGAPKIRAMEIIAELEQAPRGIYCGAIGWADPAGPMRFNVAIRTPVMEGEGCLRVNVGGGITHDSRAGSEWEEAICKSAFLGLSPQG